ncbi:MAG: hypothetical protein O2894_00090 [Planctomycetota bacterium]|nr:hypothetical protein [Planctomycetota bacterium]
MNPFHAGRAVFLGPVACLLLALALPASAGELGPWREALESPTHAGAREAPTLPAVMTLREAARRGLVAAEGFDPGSYKSVRLRVRNLGEEPLRVDICGSHLEPEERGSCQRLGLGPVVTPREKKLGPQHRRPPETPPGTVIIGLEAGEEQVVHVNTCCCDAGKPAPSTQRFTVALEALEGVRVQALRWWADNPTARQGVVNRAIWQFQPVDASAAARSAASTRRFVGGSAVAAHAGVVYLLRRGELMARDPDGIERFLGTEMEAVFPTDSAIYAIAPGSVEGSRELWRLVPTGEDPWARVARLSPALHLDDIRVSPTGAIFALGSEGLYLVDPRLQKVTLLLAATERDNLAIAFPDRTTALVTSRRPGSGGYHQGGERKGEKMPVCEVYEIDLRGGVGRPELSREFWNVRQVLAGDAGVFALSPGGKLRRLVGRSFRNAPGQTTYERIVHVGRHHAWLETKQGLLEAVDAAGRALEGSAPQLPEAGAFAFDDHDDRLVWRAGEAYWALSAKGGKRVSVAPPPLRRR